MNHCISFLTASALFLVSSLWQSHGKWGTWVSIHVFHIRKYNLGLRGGSVHCPLMKRCCVGSWDAYMDHCKCCIWMMLVHPKNSDFLHNLKCGRVPYLFPLLRWTHAGNRHSGAVTGHGNVEASWFSSVVAHEQRSRPFCFISGGVFSISRLLGLCSRP